MVTLTIDAREIEVAAGTKVIEAAAQLGIMIPRFCYHPALGSVGACRVCAVKIIEGPVKGIQMSCMLAAAEGMVVSTTDDEAVDFRRHVIEWLMVNHPHDCPVCDEGGHCLLQDMTIAGGHGIRRFPGRKRTYPDQDLGPLLQHEMNRCIHCYRCARFYQEFCGGRDLGALGIGYRTYFGRVKSGTLESPFAGNLSDLCPTGVFTDKPSRFFGRRWDYERTPTICIHCSLGCHTTTSVRYRQVARQEARFSAEVNGHFICDRGRYGFFYASRPERPRRPRIDGAQGEMDPAIAFVRERLAAIRASAGAGAIAAVGSLRSSLETQVMLQRAARLGGWREPAFFTDANTARKVRAALALLKPGLAVSLRQIETADPLIVVGADPVNEAPMLALAFRQAVRNGGRVAVLDPRPVDLPCDFRHIPLSAHALASALERLAADCVGPAEEPIEPSDAPAPDPGAHLPALDEAAGWLRQGRRPVIVCGTDLATVDTLNSAAAAAHRLGAAGKQAGLFFLMPGANASGAGLVSKGDEGLAEVLVAAEQGSVRALVLVENDPFTTFPDLALLEGALSRVELLVVLDCLDTAAADAAHVFLPTQTVYESGGCFVNQEGRLQESLPALAGGTPVRDTGGGGHPPRVYGAALPGAEPRPAWQVLARIIGDDLQREDLEARIGIRAHVAAATPGLAAVAGGDGLPPGGIRIAAADGAAGTAAGGTPAGTPPAGDELEVVFTDRTFGTEELSAASPCLGPLAADAQVQIHADDARALGIADGDRIAVGREPARFQASARVCDHMATGTLVVPRDRRLPWQKIGARVRRADIRKM